MNMKAQVMLEFLVVFSLFLFLLLIYSIAFSGYFTNYYISNKNLNLFSKVYTISSAINSVFLAGNGSTSNVSLDLTDINITISNSIITLRTENLSSASSTLITNNVNILSFNQSGMKISNVGDRIEIS